MNTQYVSKRCIQIDLFEYTLLLNTTLFLSVFNFSIYCMQVV